MERLEKPYKSNCTRYWTKTNYSEFVDDPDERHYNGRRNQIKYSTAVIILKELYINFLFSIHQLFIFSSNAIFLKFIFLNLHLKQCKRICLLSGIAMDCECIHPLYLDFDYERRSVSEDDIDHFKMCNLTQGSKFSYYLSQYIPLISLIIIFLQQ